MNTNTMSSTAFKPSGGLLPLNPNRPPPLSKSVSSLRFRILPTQFPHFSHSPIRASSQNSSPKITGKIRNQVRVEKPNPGNPSNPFWIPLRATVVTTVAAAAIFFSRFSFPLKPAIAAPVASSPAAVEVQDSISMEETEKSLEEHLLSNPDDINGLKNLMEIKIKSKKVPEAIEILDKLTELEPEEVEWPMMKAHLYAYDEEFGLAKFGFNELLKKDPLRLEAYHGLVTVASHEESSEELANIEKKVDEAMKLCKKDDKKSELRDFKLLLAQIRVLEGKYDEALKVYQDLVKEEPRDFRPYLCQGIIYTLLRKNNEAEKSFEKYRRLVPKGHPYASYFDDNMIATKLFAQKVENERAMANN